MAMASGQRSAFSNHQARQFRALILAARQQPVARTGRVAGQVTADVVRALTTRDWRTAERMDWDEETMDRL